MSERDLRAAYPLTIGRRLSVSRQVLNQSITIAVTQRKIIEDLGKKEDCAIVGHCADVILAHLRPFRIFVHADRPSELMRCQERALEGEHFSVAEMERRMRQIDKNRVGQHDMVANIAWGAKEGYDLCINTSGRDIKELVPALTEYIRRT